MQKQKAQGLGLTQKKSAPCFEVQAEKPKSDDDLLLAGVYLNRMRNRRMPLQADPNFGLRKRVIFT